MQAIEFEEHHRPCSGLCLIGREHDLPDGEADVAIGDDRAVRTHFNLGGLLVHVDGNGVALDVGFDGEVREQLHRKNPGFEGAVLLAEHDSALAGDGEGLLSFGVRANHGASAVEGDCGHGVQKRCLRKGGRRKQ